MGRRLDRHAATRRLRHLAEDAGVRLPRMHPHMLPLLLPVVRPAAGAAARGAAVPLEEQQGRVVLDVIADRLEEDARDALRHTYVTTMLDAGVDVRDVQIAARHADPRTTMRYDRARTTLDRHPNYLLAAYMASGT